MLELMKQLDCEKTAVLGYRDSDMFLKDEFEAVGGCRDFHRRWILWNKKEMLSM